MLWSDVTGPLRQPLRPDDSSDRRIRRSWLLFVGSFLFIGAVMLLRLVDRPGPADLVLLVGLVVLGYAAVVHWTALRDLEAGRRAQAESFARILSGLSRSVSPDAIVSAIVEDLGSATQADHVVVVKRRPDARLLEATLVSSRPGVRSSTTLFPLSDLIDPVSEPFRVERRRIPAMAFSSVADRRERVAVPLLVGRPVAVERVATWNVERAPTLDPGPDVAEARAVPVAPVPGPADGTRSGPTGAPPSPAPPPAAGRIAERIAARVRSAYGLKHTLAAPLRVEDETVGAIVISRRIADEWPEAAQRLLAAAAGEASAALARAYSHRQAETLASTDALTNLPNRRYFDEFCGLLARRRRSDDAAGVLMIDIDHFKMLNDRFGHGVGDDVLREVAGAIAGAVREADVPARYGGEEFAVLLRNPSLDVAVEVAERVRTSVADLNLRDHGVSGVSVSVGVAVAQRADEPIADLVARADAALYRAKRAGRNRVMAA